MSVLKVKDRQTGSWKTIKSIKGDKGDPGSVTIADAELDITVDGSNNLLEIIQKICDKIGLEYQTELKANYLGFVTPMDGAYSDWVYNNMNRFGDDIYWTYLSYQTHWNGRGLHICRTVKYNTKTRETEWWYNKFEGSDFAASALIWEPTDECFYLFNPTYRYKSDDLGRTWTREQHGGAPSSSSRKNLHYMTRLSNGRYIVAVDDKSAYTISISDDKGMTWTTRNPFSANYCLTHAKFYELDPENDPGTVVVYFFNPAYTTVSTQANRKTSSRYFAISHDYGTTWTEPKICEGELAYAAVSYMTGAFAKYGGVYHYFAAERLPDVNNQLQIGRVRWFTGTKEQVLTGTMELQGVLADVTVKTSVTTTNIWSAMSESDSGNIGCCVGSDGIYVVFGSIIDQLRSGKDYYGSNQGLKMYRIGVTDIGDAEDTYLDKNYITEMNAKRAALSTDHDYYAYSAAAGSILSNLPGVTYRQYGDGSRMLPYQGKLAIPVGNADFELNLIYRTYNHKIPRNDGVTGYVPLMIIGLQTVEGKLYALYGNPYAGVLNAEGEGNALAGALYSADTSYAYLTMKRVNGDLFITLNGTTIKNPPFDQYVHKSQMMIQGIDSDSIVWNYELFSDDGAMASYVEGMDNIAVGGIRMLTLDIDSGDESAGDE